MFISVSKCQAYNKPSINKDRAPSLFRLYRNTQKLTALVVDPEKTDKMPLGSSSEYKHFTKKTISTQQPSCPHLNSCLIILHLSLTPNQTSSKETQVFPSLILSLSLRYVLETSFSPAKGLGWGHQHFSLIPLFSLLHLPPPQKNTPETKFTSAYSKENVLNP